MDGIWKDEWLSERKYARHWNEGSTIHAKRYTIWFFNIPLAAHNIFFFATIPLVCSSLPLFEFKFTHRRTMWRYRWRSVMRIRKRKMYANMYSYYYYIASYEIYTFSILPPSSSSSSFVVPLTSASTISSIGRCVCVCCALHHFFVLNGVLVDVLYLYLLVKCDGFIVHIAKGLPVTKPFALSTTDLAYNHLDGI